MPYLAIKSNIAESLNVIVQIERRPVRRFVSEVLAICGYDPSSDQYDFRHLAVAQPDTCQGMADDPLYPALTLSNLQEPERAFPCRSTALQPSPFGISLPVDLRAPRQ